MRELAETIVSTHRQLVGGRFTGPKSPTIRSAPPRPDPGRDLLGYSPSVPPDEGLRRTIAHFRDRLGLVASASGTVGTTSTYRQTGSTGLRRLDACQRPVQPCARSRTCDRSAGRLGARYRARRHRGARRSDAPAVRSTRTTSADGRRSRRPRSPAGPGGPGTDAGAGRRPRWGRIVLVAVLALVLVLALVGGVGACLYDKQPRRGPGPDRPVLADRRWPAGEGGRRGAQHPAARHATRGTRTAVDKPGEWRTDTLILMHIPARPRQGLPDLVPP